jgi:hypothetical protein
VGTVESICILLKKKGWGGLQMQINLVMRARVRFMIYSEIVCATIEEKP